MRIRSQGLVLLAGLSILVAACGPAAQSAAPTAAPPSTPASSEPSTPASAPPSAGAGANLKIGVVTDVGTVNDKNFNEYTYVGAQQGAAAVGAAEPPVVVPTSDADYGPLIQAFVDQDFDVIVATGFNLVPATAAAVKANPDIWLIGVDHDPCLNAAGRIDTQFAARVGDSAD